MIKTEVTGIGDPFVISENGIYYMYATSAKDGFKYYTSTDLVNWKDQGYCYKDSKWGSDCFWAPEVYRYKEKYYMFYTARWVKNRSLRIGLAVSDSPQGPFKDINDGPMFDMGYATIDATLLIDGNRNYLYFVKDCSENVIDGVHTSQIFGVELDGTLTKFIGAPVLISSPDEAWERVVNPKWCWNEGPAVIKARGKYYLNFSVNCFDNRNYCVACSESLHPLGPFKKYRNNPILKYVENEFSGPGHNCFFRTFDGQLMTAFHIHTRYDAPSGDRRACFAPVVFENDLMKIKI